VEPAFIIVLEETVRRLGLQLGEVRVKILIVLKIKDLKLKEIDLSVRIVLKCTRVMRSLWS